MAEHSLTHSPFDIPREDVEALCNSAGFQVLRSYLAGDADFCATHANSSTQARETWLLHRDLLHALIMPVVELFKRASTLAEAALCTRASEDLELAFAGEARGAFICLQCFITEEEDWCRTHGCPACVTTATLSTESHIRLTIASSLLSTAPLSSASSPATSPASETPTPSSPAPANPTLPPLPHILPALRAALASDPFWGPEHWTYLLSRASQLSAGIQALIAECVDLEALVLSPRATPHPRPAVEEKKNGAKVRVGQVAKRQLRMQAEERDFVRRSALQCWARAAVPSRVREEVLGRGGGRVRRLSCP